MALGFVALNSYSIADTYFVGQLGTLPLAAMGFTFPVSFAMIAVGLGVGIGTSSVIARLLGTGDRATVQRITTHALMLSVVFGLFLLAVGLATLEPVFRALGADERTLPLITEYMRVYYLGSMFLILPMVGNFAIRATGDAMVPAVILGLSAIINVILDPLLIFGLFGFPRLELQGAAIATVIANAVTVVASVAVLYWRERLILRRHFGFAELWDGQLERVRRAVSFSTNFLMFYGLVIAAVLFIIARPTAAFFDDNPLVIDTATAYLRIVPFTYGTFGMMMISVGCFNSLGRPMPAAVLTFVKFFVVYLPLAWWLSILMGLDGIFWASALSHLVFGFISLLWLRQFLKTLVGGESPGGKQMTGIEGVTVVGPIQ
jgi:Na+-driven multidrug efflux pump